MLLVVIKHVGHVILNIAGAILLVVEISQTTLHKVYDKMRRQAENLSDNIPIITRNKRKEKSRNRIREGEWLVCPAIVDQRHLCRSTIPNVNLMLADITGNEDE